MSRYDLRVATPDDADGYVRCHVDCLAETYATTMPPAFVAEHRAEIPAVVERTRAAWQEAVGRPEPRTQAWLARDADGAVVGVVRSGPGCRTGSAPSAPR